MEITGGRIIFWLGATVAAGGVATMAVNSILYSNLEEYRKGKDYRIWSRLIRKATTQDVCEDRLGGKWMGGYCNEPQKPKKGERIILPNRLIEVPDGKVCSELGGYQRINSSTCIEPGTIFMPEKEFGKFNTYKVNSDNVIFSGSAAMKNLLKTGGVPEGVDPYEVEVRNYEGGEQYVVVFKPQTFGKEEEYLFPKTLKGVSIDHLCSRLDNTTVFPIEKKQEVKRINRKNVFLLNEKNKQMWNCGLEKRVILI